MSTKLYSNALTPLLLTATALPAGLTTVDGDRVWKRSDCRRVLTTSNGAVTIDPHIPPRLANHARGDQLTLLTSDSKMAYPPPARCTKGDTDREVFVFGSGAIDSPSEADKDTSCDIFRPVAIIPRSPNEQQLEF